MNENVAQPSLPAEAHEGVLRGLYRFRAATTDVAASVAAGVTASSAHRGAALRRHFDVDSAAIVEAALRSL